MITFFLASLYVTYLMVEAAITRGLRLAIANRSPFFLVMLSCEKCSALWAGFFCLLLQVINPVLLYPLAGAGAVLLLWPLWKKVSD